MELKIAHPEFFAAMKAGRIIEEVGEPHTMGGREEEEEEDGDERERHDKRGRSVGPHLDL